MSLNNPDYSEGLMVMLKIAEESETFRILLEGLIKDTDAEYPTNQAWMGTLPPGRCKIHTQVKLVVTQDPKCTIDED